MQLPESTSPISKLGELLILWAVFWITAGGIGFLLSNIYASLVPTASTRSSLLVGFGGTLASGLAMLLYGEKSGHLARIFEVVRNFSIFIAIALGFLVGHYWYWPHVYSTEETAFRRITHRMCGRLPACRIEANKEAELKGLTTLFPSP